MAIWAILLAGAVHASGPRYVPVEGPAGTPGALPVLEAPTPGDAALLPVETLTGLQFLSPAALPNGPALHAVDDDGAVPAPRGEPEAVQPPADANAARAPPAGSSPDLLERVPDSDVRLKLERKIYQDPLTGLSRRAWIEDRLSKITESHRAVMLLDLDHFKTGVNDAHGHGVGDLALQELAKLLVAEDRPGRAVARWGGEEFLIVEDLDRVEAVDAAERLREKVLVHLAPAVRERARSELGREIELDKLTVSIGVAPIVRDQGSAHSNWIASLEEADAKLYAAKADGRDRVASVPSEHWKQSTRPRSAADRLANIARQLLPGLKRHSVLSGRMRWAAAKETKEPVEQLLAQVADPDLRAALEKRIYTDALTGAGNRARLNDHASALLAKHKTVAALDIDLFKKINDEHGHRKGDETLVALVALLQARFGADAVYRMGGEEFLVLLEDDAQAGHARIVEAVREADEKLGAAVGLAKVTFSAGVAALPTEGAPSEKLRDTIEKADAALYESKRAGRNRATLASP